MADAAQKGREMLNEAERTVEERIAAADQKLNEAQNILDEAQEKQTEMIKSAQLAAKQERDRYEHGLINLEMQKSELCALWMKLNLPCRQSPCRESRSGMSMRPSRPGKTQRMHFERELQS